MIKISEPFRTELLSYVYEARFRYPSNWPIPDALKPEHVEKLKEARLDHSRDIRHATFRDIERPPVGADSDRCRAYLRRIIRDTTLQNAFFSAMGEPSDPPFRESLILAVWLGANMGWPQLDALAAHAAEWDQSQMKALSIVETMETKARRLSYERAPGARIIAEVEEITVNAGVYATRDQLLSLCKRIALSTVKGRRRGR